MKKILMLFMLLLALNVVSAETLRGMLFWGIYYNEMSYFTDPNTGETSVKAYLDLAYDINPALKANQTNTKRVWHYYPLENYYKSSDGGVSNMSLALIGASGSLCTDNSYISGFQSSNVWPSFGTHGLPMYIYDVAVDCNYQGVDCQEDSDGWTVHHSYSDVYTMQLPAGDMDTRLTPWGIAEQGDGLVSSSLSQSNCRYPDIIRVAGKTRASMEYTCPNNATNILVKFMLIRNNGYATMNIPAGGYFDYSENKMCTAGGVCHTLTQDDLDFDPDLVTVFGAGEFAGVSFDSGFTSCSSFNSSADGYNTDISNGNFTSPYNGNESSKGQVDEANNEGIGNTPASIAGDLPGFQGLNKQAMSNNGKLAVANKLNWQMSMLQIIEKICSIILLLYYVIIMSVISGLVLVKVPGMLRKILNTFKEFGKLRRY